MQKFSSVKKNLWKPLAKSLFSAFSLVLISRPFNYFLPALFALVTLVTISRMCRLISMSVAKLNIKFDSHQIVPLFALLPLHLVASSSVGWLSEGVSHGSPPCCAFHKQRWGEWRRWRILLAKAEGKWLTLYGDAQWDASRYSLSSHIKQNVAFGPSAIRKETELQEAGTVYISNFCYFNWEFRDWPVTCPFLGRDNSLFTPQWDRHWLGWRIMCRPGTVLGLKQLSRRLQEDYIQLVASGW